MSNNILSKIKNNFIGRQFAYTKTGSRRGWVGTILSVDEANQKVIVEYSNGIEQTYSPWAFQLEANQKMPAASLCRCAIEMPFK